MHNFTIWVKLSLIALFILFPSEFAMYILTLNTRHQTLHFKLFSWPDRIVLADGHVAGIGGESGTLCARNANGLLCAESVYTFDHEAALRSVEEYLST